MAYLTGEEWHCRAVNVSSCYGIIPDYGKYPDKTKIPSNFLKYKKILSVFMISRGCPKPGEYLEIPTPSRLLLGSGRY